jgi:hypothetical protein
MPSNLIYLIGFVIVIGGLAYGADLMGISAQWIAVGVVVLAGMALIGVSKKGKSKDTFET